ncbi:hypothetical protein AC249_AIPGENE14729 [Exaiptasia diaphana]|nr:hypothetical protein AC249_AIPGENE14729 [Exaiptasia diaphana]
MKSRVTFHLLSNLILDGNYDIFTISESWLDYSITDSDKKIHGYITFRQDRGEHISGGGLVVYIKDYLKAETIENSSTVSTTDFQQLWLKIQCKHLKSFLLCTVYKPPDAQTTGALTDLTNSIVDSLLHGLDILITGDLNIDMLVNSYDRKLLEDLRDLSTTLTLKLKTPKEKPRYITARNYKTYNSKNFNNDIDNVPFHITEIFDEIDDKLNAYNLLFTQVLDVHAPVKVMKIRCKPNPCVTPEIKALMKTRDKWHKSAIKTNDKLHWNAYRFFRQEVKRELRIEEKQQIPLPNVQDSRAQANLFNEYYASVGQTTSDKVKELVEQHALSPPPSIPNTGEPTHNVRELFTLQPISEEVTRKIIESIPTNKAPGLDDISAKAIKDSIPSSLTTITSIINDSFETNTFPAEWKASKVIPCPKTKGATEPMTRARSHSYPFYLNPYAMGYVDDTKLFLAFPSSEITEAVQALNSDLQHIVEWCCANQLLLNPEKTKIVAIGVPQRLKRLQPITNARLEELPPTSNDDDDELPVIKVKLAGDGTALSRANSLFVLSCSLLNDELKVMSSSDEHSCYLKF